MPCDFISLLVVGSLFNSSYLLLLPLCFRPSIPDEGRKGIPRIAAAVKEREEGFFRRVFDDAENGPNEGERKGDGGRGGGLLLALITMCA